ncbi:MAG: hypothetical protein ILO53_06365 [Clostridia bacterium]|nr:hypothetical protein [Clostridia bacterium]
MSTRGIAHRRFAAALLSFVLFVLFLCMPFSSDAKVVFISDPNDLHAGEYTASPLLASKLIKVFDGDIDLFDGSTETYLPIGCTMNNKTMFTVTSKTSGSKIYGYQCYIYANAVYNYLYNEYVGHGNQREYLHSENVLQNAGGTASYEQFKKAGVMCGAYLRTTANSDGSYNGSNGHSLIVLKYDENEITYIEGNGEGIGLVRGAVLSWDVFNARQLSGRSRVICNVTQPTRSYYLSVYGVDYATLSFNIGEATGKTPATMNISYFDTIRLPVPEATPVDPSKIFYGWTAKRNKDGYVATYDKGFVAPSSISNGTAEAKIFKPDRQLPFDLYWSSPDPNAAPGSVGFTFTAVWVDAPKEVTVQGDSGALNATAGVTKRGKDTVFSVNVRNNPGVAYMELRITLSEGLFIESLENGAVLGGMYSGEVITWKMAGNSAAKGILLSAVIRNAEGVKGGTVSYEIITCCGEQGNVNYTAANRSLNVTF